eukprot:1036389-Rhodomonas_salina.1
MWQAISSDQPWDVKLLASTTQTWDSDATAALGLVSLLSHGALPVLEPRSILQMTNGRVSGRSQSSRSLDRVMTLTWSRFRWDRE